MQGITTLAASGIPDPDDVPRRCPGYPGCDLCKDAPPQEVVAELRWLATAAKLQTEDGVTALPIGPLHAARLYQRLESYWRLVLAARHLSATITAGQLPGTPRWQEIKEAKKELDQTGIWR